MLTENNKIFNIYKKSHNLVCEGGAAGHMMHPFDLPDVKTSHDLLSIFDTIENKLQQGSATVKLDGVNVSLKIVDKPLTPSMPKQFALDRGSQKEIDVHGITIDNLESRFPPDPVSGKQHGMVEKGGTILRIMNNSLPFIKDEIIKLGLWDDPTKFINTEYIKGKENVIDYGKDVNLIAFHGINQFYEKVNRRGEVTRPGLKPKKYKDPKTGKEKVDKTVSRKINYDVQTLDLLRDEVKPIANEFGFDIVTGIYVNKKGSPDFNKILNQPFTVNFSKTESRTQPLKAWVDHFNLPKNVFLYTKAGKKLGAISKENYLAVLDGNYPGDPGVKSPLDDIYDEQYISDAVNGAITYHLTRVLGQEILQNYTTDNYGDASGHEGIVLTDKLFGRDEHGNASSVKITGDFILSGMAGKLSKIQTSPEDEQSAPEVNYGNGQMNFRSYFSYPRSSKDPGGDGFRKK